MYKSFSYDIAENLFDSLKDFIVLGLCGRTGSGCSTVADILSKNFPQLNLPAPSQALNGSIQSAEELILYNYAKENWVSFYQIKVSRLMTGYLLTETPDTFMEYLDKMFYTLPSSSKATIQTAIGAFWDAEMEFELPLYFCQKIINDFPTHASSEGSHSETIITGEKILAKFGGFLTESAPCELLFSSASPESITSNIARQLNKEPPFQINCQSKVTYQYDYQPDPRRCTFRLKLRDMQKLVEEYAVVRKGKGAFENKLIYWLLYEYAYHALPEHADRLWNKIGTVRRGLPTMIMQDIGINLRTWGRPLVYDAKTQEIPFQDAGFSTIVQRINLYLKILRDYLKNKKEYRNIFVNTSIKNNSSSSPEYRECLQRLDQETKQVVAVIDSIKNPFESLYLKARYSSYFLTAINTDEAERNARLQSAGKNLTADEIQTINTIEQLGELKNFLKSPDGRSLPPKDESSMLSKTVLASLTRKLHSNEMQAIFPFITQNVEHCVESADIFINNHHDNNQYLSLKKKLVRYVSLIMNPGLVLPTEIERCMQIAQTAKVNSGCISRQVGAVLTDSQYRVRSVGWNEVPAGRVPCIYRDMMEVKQHWNPKAYSAFENDDNDDFQRFIHPVSEIDSAYETMLKKGKRIPYCFKDIQNAREGNKNQVHPRALHAEERAFLSLSDQGGASIEGGYLFTTSSPCELCAKKACFMCISKVYYVEPYSGISFKHVMRDGPEDRWPEQELFTGALGRAYTYLYTPVLPPKDELELWLGFKLNGKDRPAHPEEDSPPPSPATAEPEAEAIPAPCQPQPVPAPVPASPSKDRPKRRWRK